MPVQPSIEAPTIYHARLRLALRGIGNAADYSDGNEVDAERVGLIPRDFVGQIQVRPSRNLAVEIRSAILSLDSVGTNAGP